MESKTPNYCLIRLLDVYSGGVKLYFPDKSEHDESNGLELCGKIENLTLLITDKALDLKAWGFGYYRHDDEYRDRTRFLLDYEAVPGELTTVIGKDGYIKIHVAQPQYRVTVN